MKFLRSRISIFSFSLILTIYFFLAINFSFLKDVFGLVQNLNFNNILFLSSIFGLLFVLLFIFFYLIFFKYITKFFALLFILLSCISSYFILNYNVYIDSAMIRSVFETDSHEAFSYFEFGIFNYFFCFLILPSLFVIFIKIQYPGAKKFLLQKVSMLCACLIYCLVLFFFEKNQILSFYHENSKIFGYISPFNYVYAITGYTKEKFNKDASKFLKIGLDAKMGTLSKKSDKKMLVIFVVGETARSSSFSLNGYTRKTNPKLEKKQVFSFTNFYSCSTLTTISVPCIFSNFGRQNFTVEKSEQTENLLDLASRAGYNVIWFDNNGGSKNVANRVKEISLSELNDPKYCHQTACLDEILISHLPSKEDLLKFDGNHFMILHQIGSHGPRYFDRYTEEYKKFTPECRETILKNCPEEAIINSYDNSILYTDNNLNEIINYLESFGGVYNTAMLYVSDHGESTGESDIYMHGIPYDIAPHPQIHIPFIVWLSDDYKKLMGLNSKCLNHVKEQNYSHDNIFHSLLGILDIQTSVYNRDLDLFNSCQNK